MNQVENIAAEIVVPKKRSHKKFKTSSVIIFAVLILYTIFLFTPFYVAIVTSLTSSEELNSSLSFIWWPQNGISFDAYKIIFTSDVFQTGIPILLLGFLNTMWMSLCTVFVSLFVSGMAAYSYSKLNFPGKEKLFMIEIATMMIPTAALTMPTYLFYDSINWTGTVLPVLIPGMFGGASTIFFLRMYFDSMGKDTIEAAKIDGLGVFGIYVLIMIPLAVPAFIAQLIFLFVGRYNDYMTPLIYLYDQTNLWPLQLALSELRGVYSSNTAVKCAAAIVALAPMIILYCFLQRFFIQGISVGATKE